MKYVITQVENLRTTHDNTPLEPFEYEYDDGTRVIPMLFDQTIHAGIIDALQTLRLKTGRFEWALRYDVSTSRQLSGPIITTGYEKITMSQLLIELFESGDAKPTSVHRRTERIDQFLEQHPVLLEVWNEVLMADLGFEFDLDIRTCWTMFAYPRYIHERVTSKRVKRALLKLIDEVESKSTYSNGYSFDVVYWEVIPTGTIDLEKLEDKSAQKEIKWIRTINEDLPSDLQHMELIKKQNNAIEDLQKKIDVLQDLIKDCTDQFKDFYKKKT